MKQTIICLLCFLAAGLYANAQSDAAVSYYPVVVGEGIPAQARQALVARMEQAITQNGSGASDCVDRFVMLAKCNILEKDVAPTTPPRIMQTVEVTFILGDVIENKTYASVSFELKGIGTNETKAWQTAFSSLKSGDSQFKTMFEDAMGKIKSYYSANCVSIIAEAKTLASAGQYDRAIYSLMSVPGICAECRNDALAEAAALYQQKIDAEAGRFARKGKEYVDYVAGC